MTDRDYAGRRALHRTLEPARRRAAPADDRPALDAGRAAHPPAPAGDPRDRRATRDRHGGDPRGTGARGDPGARDQRPRALGRIGGARLPGPRRRRPARGRRQAPLGGRRRGRRRSPRSASASSSSPRTAGSSATTRSSSPELQPRSATRRSSRDARIPASSRAGAGPPRAPPGSGGCGVRGSSSCLASSTQQMNSLRASGVMSFHASSAVALAINASRRSAGSLCTTPPGTRWLLTGTTVPARRPWHVSW